MRVLGIDLGSRRIGLALSDPEGRIASPAGMIERRGGKRDLEAMKRWIVEHEVGSVVVGLPIHMSGRRGPEAAAARRFASELGTATGLPVDLIDERLTTREAENALRESGRKGARRRAVIDSVAASILLRTYLETRALRRAPDPGDVRG